MKTVIFDMMKFEWEYYNAVCGDRPDVKAYTEPLTLDGYGLIHGYDAISINSHTVLTEGLCALLHSAGVHCVSTRTVGVDHIDLKAAAKYGIRIYNSRFNSANVAEFTIMSLLELFRKTRVIAKNVSALNLRLEELQGRELRGSTVGVIGTGKIGSSVVKLLFAFGCKVYAYDAWENPELTGLCEYKDLDFLLKNCDVLSLHLPLSDASFHIIDGAAFDKMKDGVYLVNTARGALVDTKALVRALEAGKVAGAALDVVEDDESVVHGEQTDEALANMQELHRLLKMDNVIYTPHCAFFTREAAQGRFLEALDFDREPFPLEA